MTKISDFILRASVSVIAIVALILHIHDRNLIDRVDASLIVIALLPWLASIIKTIEVTGVGKLELQAREVAKKQELLQEEVDGLRFVVTGFVTDLEFAHLQKLASTDHFPYTGASPEAEFVKELKRLWQLGLIKKRSEAFFFHDIAPSGNLEDYVEITERGRTYLSIRKEVASRALEASNTRA